MITFEGIGHSVVLPNPTWGDDKNILGNLSVRRSRSNKVYTHKSYSMKQSIDFTIMNISLEAKNYLETFLVANTGKDIQFTDWDNEHWVGQITTYPFSIVEEAPDRFTATINFVGVKAQL